MLSVAQSCKEKIFEVIAQSEGQSPNDEKTREIGALLGVDEITDFVDIPLRVLNLIADSQPLECVRLASRLQPDQTS